MAIAGAGESGENPEQATPKEYVPFHTSYFIHLPLA
jgi:hypothetical protein